MSTVCGADCGSCGMSAGCRGCAETDGRPFGEECLVWRCYRDGGKAEGMNENIGKETLVKCMQELGAGVENHEFFDIEREVPSNVQKKGEKGEGKGKKKKLKAKAATVK